MQHFSHEYRDKLIAEHRLIAASINSLTNQQYVRNHGGPTVASAIADFKMRKVQLEVMIDVLNEYLN